MATNNLIIDGTNINYRTFFISRKTPIINDNGVRIDSIEKFLETFLKLVERFDPEHIWCCWDTKQEFPSTNFRETLLHGEYKAGRTRPDDIEDMMRQQKILIELLESFGVKHFYPKRLEADDCVSFLVSALEGFDDTEMSNIVVSADHDLLQLISEGVSVYNLKFLITRQNFIRDNEMTPEDFVVYKAIKGDSSDNIRGLQGIGDKRAKKLLKTWPRINKVIDIDNVPLEESDLELVKRNLRIMDLSRGFMEEDGEADFYAEQYDKLLKIKISDFTTFKNLIKQHGLKEDKLYRWSKMFKRNTLVDLINALPEV